MADCFSMSSHHKEGIKPLVEAGIISLGGPTLVSHQLEGEEQQINGSVILVNKKSKAEVLEIVQRDVYSSSGIRDLDKVSRKATGLFVSI